MGVACPKTVASFVARHGSDFARQRSRHGSSGRRPGFAQSGAIVWNGRRCAESPSERHVWFRPLYNRTVPDFDRVNRSAILSRDTSADIERLQIEAWRRMSPLEKAATMTQATSDAATLALAGIRQRHPGASSRECFIRLAALQLGPTLVRQVYPDASQILGPHV